MPFNQDGTPYFTYDSSAPWSKRLRPRTNSTNKIHEIFKEEISYRDVNTFEESGFMTAAKEEKKPKIRSSSAEPKKSLKY